MKDSVQEQHTTNTSASGGSPDATQTTVAKIIGHTPFRDNNDVCDFVKAQNNSQEIPKAFSPQEQWNEVCENLDFKTQSIRSLDGKHYRSEVLLKPVDIFVNIPGFGHFEKKYSIPEIINLAEKTGNTFALLEKALEFTFEKASREPESILSVNSYIEDFLEKDPENGKNKLLELVRNLQEKFSEVKPESIIIELLENPYTEE